MTQRDAAIPDQPKAKGADDPGRNMADLLFRLDDETFAVPVSGVNEIIDPQRMSPVPNANPLAPSIINVRGSIIPLFDVRARLAMEPATTTSETRMIVFERTGSDGEPLRLAFSADAVERVVERGMGGMTPLPELGVAWPHECLSGSYRHEGELIICLDVDAVFCVGGTLNEAEDLRGSAR